MYRKEVLGNFWLDLCVYVCECVHTHMGCSEHYAKYFTSYILYFDQHKVGIWENWDSENAKQHV